MARSTHSTKSTSTHNPIKRQLDKSTNSKMRKPRAAANWTAWLPAFGLAVSAAYNHLRAAGVLVGASPHCIAKNWNGRDSWLAHFNDPSGNQLAFKVDGPVP